MGSHRPRRFTADDVDLLRTIGQQVCAWVEHAQLYAATSRYLMEMKALQDTGHATTSSLDLGERLQALLERLARAAGAQRAMVGLMDAPDATRCRLCVGYDSSKATPWLRHLDLLPERYPEIQEVMRTLQPLVIPDVFAEPLLAPVRHHLELVGLRSLVALPLLIREQAIGAVSLGYVGQGRTFTDDEIRFCQSMADLAAAAIANAQLFQQVARAKAEWESTFDSMHDLAAIIDAEHRLVRVNRALAERLGVAPEALVGQPAYTALHGTDAPGPRCPYAQTLATGKPITLEAEDPHLGGTFLITTSPVINAEGRAGGCVHIARDITELKRLEEEARRTWDLEAANQQLQAASRHKSEFLANMSHELRTPLNSILGFSEVLREQTVGPLNEKQARYINHIWNSGKHLLQLISDILDLAKVEAGKFVLQPESLPVASTLEDILVIARGLANKKGQTVVAEIEPDLPPLRADPVRFKQILFNLLSNAVKFTPEGGQITVTVRRVPGIAECGMRNAELPATDTVPQSAIRNPQSEIGECLEIRVGDTGPGIKAEDLPRLFQEFVQLEAAKRHEGTGLGLALTKRLVEMHGGRIWAASEGEGHGSTFTVVLPFGGPPES